MELRHVKIFVLAAEYQNFSKVAEFAFISQSSVSKYIQILEDELGGALFVRDGRHTELSEFGRAFLPHAISILEKRTGKYLAKAGFHGRKLAKHSGRLATTRRS